MSLNILEISYLIASLTFILGLKMLSNPDSARKGNLIAAAGMLIAIIATITLYQDFDSGKLVNYGLIFLGLIIGTVIGTIMAKKVQMTSMPQMVSFFNGMGGACAALIAIIDKLLMVSHGTLFRLFGCMITNMNKGFYNMVKRVDIIVI